MAHLLKDLSREMGHSLASLDEFKAINIDMGPLQKALMSLARQVSYGCCCGGQAGGQATPQREGWAQRNMPLSAQAQCTPRRWGRILARDLIS